MLHEGCAVTRSELLNALIAHYDYRSYLEIGIRDPRLNYDRVKIPSKVGVEPSRSIKEPRSNIVGTTSDTFFEMFPTMTFDLVFIDGDHSYGQTTRDIDNSVAHLIPGGTVVVHDVNPLHETHQGTGKHLGRTEVNPCSLGMVEAWKAWVDARTAFNSATVIVRDDIDAPSDCGVIQPWNMKLFVLATTEETPEDLVLELPEDYAAFDAHRGHWLNLMTWEEMKECL